MAQHETAGEFMGLMFMSRDMAHREHLKTRSYATHKALGKFYPDIVDLADKFAEAYQGGFGKLLSIPLLNVTEQEDIAEALQAHVDWINENRAEISPEAETAINNIIDEIVGLYYSTLYKLRFLS